MTTRREFLRHAALGGSALGFGMTPLRAAGETALDRIVTGRAPRALNILILGGTGFTGPHQVAYAVARGHTVTVFNRGRSEADLPDGVERLYGDRNASELDALRGRTWDVVIDNPTSLPFWVRDAGQILGNATSQYIFISTISVYASTAQVGMDETAATAPYNGEDALAERQVGPLYGALKAASEREAEKWFPGKVTVIRPGLIVGDGDESDRFTYWPVRVARGGEVLAPGRPGDPVQFIDARDLAEWTIRMAESKSIGVYNATGPATELGIGAMLDGMKQAIGSNATFTWVPAEFLAEQRVRPWSHMPVWVPPVGQTAGFAQVSIARALEKGLTFRPLADTTRSTLEYHRSRPAERQAQLRSGITAEREAEVLAAWKARG